jgi:hypothetical protein
MKNITAVIILLLAFESSVFALNKSIIKTESIKHVLGMVRRSDNKFDVTCIDGKIEIRTEDEVNSDEICLFETTKKSWSLIKDGVSGDLRLCDVSVEQYTKDGNVLSVTVNFLSPCSEVKNTNIYCANKVCDVQLNGSDYKFDFSIDQTTLIVTRKKDGLSGTYERQYK